MCRSGDKNPELAPRVVRPIFGDASRRRPLGDSDAGGPDVPTAIAAIARTDTLPVRYRFIDPMVSGGVAAATPPRRRRTARGCYDHARVHVSDQVTKMLAVVNALAPFVGIAFAIWLTRHFDSPGLPSWLRKRRH